jgi:putative inorganic carbon (HCO3(-)) transporter
MQLAVTDQKKLYWLYGIAFVFGIAGMLSVIKGFPYLLLLPAFLVFVIAGVYRLDRMMYLAVFLTPLSINLAQTGLGIGVSLPSEPLMFAIMLVFLFHLISGKETDSRLFAHPVSLAILAHLVWMVFTTVTSSMIGVSFKATLARICFVTVFFYLAAHSFRDPKNIRKFAWYYMIPLALVIVYTTLNHAAAGFTEKAAHTAMVPLYNDHTAYAAVIAMFIPLSLGFINDRLSKRSARVAAFVFLSLFVTAIILSYTRASWLSLVAALLCYLVFLFRVRTWIVISGIAALVIFYLAFQTKITMELERTDEQSSTDYASHVQSMSNISTDASNVERLNRWACAFRMFDERPLTGWGPGTYMFQYGPFQKVSEKTIISTNFGEGGNAHSEYFGPLAEQGLPGTIFFILIGVAVIWRASRIIIYSTDNNVRMITKALLLGLITYWVHGMLNNFLDTEKASVPFWGFIAAIVAIDLYHHRGKGQQDKSMREFPAG